MKGLIKIFVFCCIVCSLSDAWGIGSYAVKDTLYTLGVSGLTLRRAPKLEAGVKGTLPYGTAVVVKALTATTDSITEASYTIVGSWVQVSTPKGDGYVFDGYLTGFEAPRLTEKDVKGDDIEAYIQERYKAMSKKMPASKNQAEFNQVFDHGIKFSKRVAPDSTAYGRIMIAEISLEEVYLIGSILCRTATDENPDYSSESSINVTINGLEITIEPASGQGLAIKAMKEKSKGGGGGAVIQYKMLAGNTGENEEKPD